jgi:hypothetical protein
MERFSLRGPDLEIEQDSDSSEEDLLPKLKAYERPHIKQNEFLKLFMQKQCIHQTDREKASSIISNLKQPVERRIA